MVAATRCQVGHVLKIKTDQGRYPTTDGGGPVSVASRLAGATGWKASGDLAFLNGWTYKLGAELLTPFGRGQLCESLPLA